MKPQKSGFKFMQNLSRNITIGIVCILSVILFISCENDIDKVNALSKELNLPDQTGKNIVVTYSDSGRIKGKLYANVVLKYSRIPEPYVEFPEGIRVVLYNKQGVMESTIRANYAIYYEKKEIWDARYNVIAKNFAKNEELYTEQLFWDQKKEEIYSDKFTKILQHGDIHYGEKGFEAQQDLSTWQLRQSKGQVHLKDEPETE